jgi:uncharacterized protein (DUF111 family)
LKRLLSSSIVVLALTLGTGTVAFADPGQVPAPPPATNEFAPGKACDHANLGKNREFDSNHATGVNGGGTPPMCVGGGA